MNTPEHNPEGWQAVHDFADHLDAVGQKELAVALRSWAGSAASAEDTQAWADAVTIEGGGNDRASIVRLIAGDGSLITEIMIPREDASLGTGRTANERAAKLLEQWAADAEADGRPGAAALLRRARFQFTAEELRDIGRGSRHRIERSEHEIIIHSELGNNVARSLRLSDHPNRSLGDC